MTWTVADFPNCSPDELSHIEHCIGLEQVLVALGAKRGVEVIDDDEAARCGWPLWDHVAVWDDEDGLLVLTRDIRASLLAPALRIVVDALALHPAFVDSWHVTIDSESGQVRRQMTIGNSRRNPLRPSDFICRQQTARAVLERAERTQPSSDRPRRLSRTERDLLIVKLHGQGERVIKIAGQASCSTSTVYNVLRRAKVND